MVKSRFEGAFFSAGGYSLPAEAVDHIEPIVLGSFYEDSSFRIHFKKNTKFHGDHPDGLKLRSSAIGGVIRDFQQAIDKNNAMKLAKASEWSLPTIKDRLAIIKHGCPAGTSLRQRLAPRTGVDVSASR